MTKAQDKASSTTYKVWVIDNNGLAWTTGCGCYPTLAAAHKLVKYLD